MQQEVIDLIKINLDKYKEHIEKLIKNQINDVDSQKKFSFSDLKRLTNNIKNDIFGSFIFMTIMFILSSVAIIYGLQFINNGCK